MKEEKDFYQLEKPILLLKEKIGELLSSEEEEERKKIPQLRQKIEKEWKKISPLLTALHIVQIARHPKRPYTMDYLGYLTQDFIEMHGDRRAGDDPAIIAGLGFYRGRTVAFIGHQKGRTTKQRLDRNFGQPNPEGYRKALRVMKLAEKFGHPVVTLIDTPGAYPGIRAEEHGQAEAIASNLKELSKLRVPVVNVVIGEGGSGGALAIGVGDVILMLEHSFYSVISPEGCAAILWKDQEATSLAAMSLKMTANDLLEMGIIDKIIPEPPGGAHVDFEQTFKNVDKELNQALKRLEKMSVENRLKARYEKFRKIGVFTEK
ncbi:MAG: acetyl-CoA carboxylase carboxyltransferase subunit alpha [Candidatus Aminicenantes bacterium]|nr:acetyl-CoA carboxylase carboxyltransferase subunit alpha [Candidatus Aminicenantes bacterium]MDH5467007.1 acetyl-CoA carboxylase carboxyltransferase subunit alpha [Candidatus Aminicenantes bacterium]MDH5704400.1 acetyl-CoA carboxylase carboxyltransferase subunit alpha [Candidatus Aminicenantes bacterium]